MDRGHRFRIAIGLVVWVTLIVTVIVGWDEVSAEAASAGARFPAAVLTIAAGLVVASAGWSVLQTPRLRAQSARAFLIAQAAKYLPLGGLAQAVGQIGLTSPSQSERRNVTILFVVHGGIQFYAAILVSGLMGFDPHAGVWVLSVVGVAAAIGAIVLRRSSLAGLLKRLSLSRWRLGEGEVPPTALLWRSCLLSTVPILLSGGAFASLAGLWAEPSKALSAVGAFSLAWAVGFVALPVPSGLGIREVILASLLPRIPLPSIVGFSLAHRFATLLAELLLLAALSRSTFGSNRART